MVDGVIGGFGAFTGLIGMARGMKDMNDAVVRNEAVYALTEKLLDVQQEYTALTQKVGELEQKLARFEDWETQKQRYELKDVRDGKVFAYILKEGVDPPEPPHSICPDCYQQRKKSILQETTRVPGMSRVLVCQVRNWEGYTSGLWQPEHGGKGARRSR